MGVRHVRRDVIVEALSNLKSQVTMHVACEGQTSFWLCAQVAELRATRSCVCGAARVQASGGGRLVGRARRQGTPHRDRVHLVGERVTSARH